MLLVPACVAQNPPWMPPNGSLHGLALDHLMRWNLLAVCICFVAAHLWLLRIVLRRKRTLEIPESDLENRALQPRDPTQYLRYTLLAALCLMYVWMAFTAQRLWARSRYAGPSPAAMQVEVVAEQFQWYFRYPGPDAAFGSTRPELVNAAEGNPLGLNPRDPRSHDDIVSSVLVLPAGREVDLHLRSLDVIHGLFIPGMRVKENAVPGLILHVHFTPLTPGTYPILCSQVCGLGHARMQAVLSVISAAEFDAWLASHASARSEQQVQ
ncbi:MAG: cytochrome C oxidase subunit II [Acidobacteriaceae bacterium]|nr:cytochrome C oxidase subunit II [Acidobacteriaceae bacterium]